MDGPFVDSQQRDVNYLLQCVIYFSCVVYSVVGERNFKT